MTTEEIYTAIGYLKLALRDALDPARLQTCQEVREALAHCHAIIYRSWRKHLVALGNDDFLARHFFDTFALTEQLHQTCKAAVLKPQPALEPPPQELTIGDVDQIAQRLRDATLETIAGLEVDYRLLRSFVHRAKALEAVLEQYTDMKIEEEFRRLKTSPRSD